MNYETAETPEAIRADIERTRADMSEKINTIQERLSPQNLQQQAQEVVRDAINTSTDTLTTYLRENSREMATSIAETIKRNPIPAALIGLGAGWLLVETFSGGGEERKRQAEAEYYRRAYYGGATPYADNYSGGTRQSLSSAGQYGYGREGSQGGVASTVEDVKDSVGKVTNQVRTQAAEIGEQIGQVGEQVRTQSQEWIGQATDQARAQTEEWVGKAGAQAGHLSEQAYRQAGRLGQQARSELDSAVRVAHRGYDMNPVVFGAVALALGAAIGMALPSTTQEDEWMGEKRDELVESAQGVVQEYGQRAQQAFEEVKPVLEQTATKVAEDLKQTGQQALEEVKATGSEAVETVKNRVQESSLNAPAEPSRMAASAPTTMGAGAQTSSGNDPYTVDREREKRNAAQEQREGV